MKEPRIKDFELTEAQLKHYEIVSFYSSYKMGITFLLICIMTICILLLIVIINPGINSESIVYGTMLGLFVAFWGAVFFSSLVPFSYDLVKKRVDSNYKNYKKYKVQKNKYDAWWIRTQVEYWKNMSGRRFEEEVAYFYSQLGYKAELTPHSNDKGIDINLEKDGIKIIVQCKAHKVQIGPAAVRELYGTLINSGADMAILATFEGVSSGASSFIKDKPIKVITIDNIIAMRKKLNTTDTKF